MSKHLLGLCPDTLAPSDERGPRAPTGARRFVALLPCAALVLSVVLAACASRPPPLDTSTPAEREIRVALRDDLTLAISPDRVPAGRVKVIATNEGSMQHGMYIEGIGVEQFIAPGTSLTQDTVFPAATWVVYCPVLDHRDRGMRGQFVSS